jgi:hypothetical protein
MITLRRIKECYDLHDYRRSIFNFERYIFKTRKLCRITLGTEDKNLMHTCNKLSAIKPHLNHRPFEEYKDNNPMHRYIP